MKIQILCIAAFISINGWTQGDECCVMYYNVENFFSPQNDSLSGEDDEFTPEGIRHWTWNRYRKKAALICKVILAANEWSPPAIIGLCEVENKDVLKTLTDHPLMINFKYKSIHRDSPDHRGMDVAILYRPEVVKLLNANWIPVCYPSGKIIPTREILAAEFLRKSEGDTLACLANHWTSKYGGAFESEEKRMAESDIMGKYIQSLHLSRPKLKIIAGGDMNDHSESRPIQNLTVNYSLKEIVPERYSTYKYQGKWESIDHAFVLGENSLKEFRATVFYHPHLLEPDVTNTGVKPYRTYAGYRYNGGVSDHLPLLIKFTF